MLGASCGSEAFGGAECHHVQHVFSARFNKRVLLPISNEVLSKQHSNLSLDYEHMFGKTVTSSLNPSTLPARTLELESLSISPPDVYHGYHFTTLITFYLGVSLRSTMLP